MRVIGASTPGRPTGLMPMLVSPVFISSALTSVGESPGRAFSSSAAEPATIGAAPEVPPKAVVPVPVPTSAETDAPGAAMSGLIELRLNVGPRDDDETMLATSGTAEAGLIAAVEPRTDFSAAPSARVIE